MLRVRKGSLKTILAMTAVLLLVAGVSPSSAAVPSRLTLSAPNLSGARLVRAADPSTPIDIDLYLGLQDAAGARAVAAAVSDPASPDYGNYLTAAEFRARFSRSQADVDAAASWLRSQGFAIGDTPASHVFVPASGTVAQAEAAFGVGLGEYEMNGKLRLQPDGAPSVPASLDGIVLGVDGLSEVPHVPASPPPAPAWITGRPCSKFWGKRLATNKPSAYGTPQPFAPCGYSATQLQGAYGVSDAIAGGTDGSGVTVAITDAYASPTIQQDLDEYSSRNGLPSTIIQQIVHPPTSGSVALQQGWWGEETLDVEAVHAMAPGANILFMGAANPFLDLDRMIADVVDNNRAQLITNSWGYYGEQVPQSILDKENDIFTQAGAEGIGIYFSSGDNGDEVSTLGYRTVDYSASSPYVTAVGGTSLGVGAFNSYLFETGWGTSRSALSRDGRTWRPTPPGAWWYGGGGGTSRIFAEPAYQQGVVPTSLSGYWGGSNRVVPDVAMDGDPNTGFTVVQTYTYPDGSVGFGASRYGGTSLSSPLFAGIMALADDQAGFAHGFANPILYPLSGTGAIRDIVDPSQTIAVVRADFNNGVDASDGKSYSLRTMNQTQSLHTIPGYDDVTGVGTPNGQAFLDALT
jgi:subtilase family serine protease